MNKDDNFELEIESVEPSRKEKKKKSTEERSNDRRVVFWVMVLVLLTCLFFWLNSALPSLMNRNEFDTDRMDGGGDAGFTVKYKI